MVCVSTWSIERKEKSKFNLKKSVFTYRTAPMNRAPYLLKRILGSRGLFVRSGDQLLGREVPRRTYQVRCG